MASRKRKTTESLRAYRNNLANEQAAIDRKLQGKVVYMSVNGPARREGRTHVDSKLSPTDRYYVPARG